MSNLTHTDQTHETFIVETTQPKNGNLILWGVVILSVFAVVTIVVSTVFYRTLDQKLQEKVLGPTSLELNQARTREKQQLSSYGWVDKERQIVHIPIDIAIKKEVEDAQ